MALQQKQRSIAALHHAASERGMRPLLEISTKSPLELGRRLSAFNLHITLANGRRTSVEGAFQGGKVFESGGPYVDLYEALPARMKHDARLSRSGALIGFEIAGERWPLEPKTAFYDWLYLRALGAIPELGRQILAFAGFTDIEFNPKRALNCQARAAALYVALEKRGSLTTAMRSQEAFLHDVA